MEKIINELLVTQPLFTHVDLCSKGWISLAPCASCTIFAESGQFQDEITMKTNWQKILVCGPIYLAKYLQYPTFRRFFMTFHFSWCLALTIMHWDFMQTPIDTYTYVYIWVNMYTRVEME